MGRATRWIKGLLGIKSEKGDQYSENSNSANVGDKKEKKRWSFAKSGKGYAGVGRIPANIPANISEAVWLRSYVSETEKEQSKHAIAVAAATAAAADAAVAAAQAAVAVVRLTSHGRGTMFNGGRERWAALKIQTVFKGYLARKALRALKGLVKLQAAVRGYLVRKRAAATLYSMQALFRAQNSARFQRARRSLTQDRARRSIEKIVETRSEYHSKRHSTSHESSSYNTFDHDSPKIVEIDTFKPRSRSRRINTASFKSDSGEDMPYPTLSSPLPYPYPYPTLLSLPEPKKVQDLEWAFNPDEYKFSTAHNTPRFTNSVHGCTPITPSKSICGDAVYRPYSNSPSYMANTQSFKAKLRSYSAPKQRPEPEPKKRLSLIEIMASRSSLSGVKMQRSCSKVQESLNIS